MLFNGATPVGEFLFDAPDDVVAFVGVHSSQPFNRAVIFDTTGDTDDEYFGQFYTGAVAAAARTFTAVARSGGAIPGGGVFAGFPSGPAVTAGRTGRDCRPAGSIWLRHFHTNRSLPQDRRLHPSVPGGTGAFTGFGELALARVGKPAPPPIRAAFLGSGGGQQGVYRCDSASPTDPCRRLADVTTAIPAGSGAFNGFAELAANRSIAGFIATGAGQRGVYSCDSATPTDPCRRIADMTTAIPDGTGTFASFSSVALALDSAMPAPPPIRVAFLGAGAGQQGVYLSQLSNVAIPTPPPIRVAHLTTPIPQGTGTFTGFTALTASDGHTAFLGTGSGGRAGIYLASAPTKVIAVGDALDGKTVAALRLGQFGFDGGALSFAATFTDGSQGVYSASVNAFHFSGFFQPVDNLPVLNRVNAGQAVPVKFSLNGNRGLDIFAAGYPKSELIPCNSTALVSGIEKTVTAGSSSLSYDPVSDQYSYVWKTEKAWANTCRQFVLTLKEGSAHRANFTFR